MNIGIFSGSFNPIHMGHLMLASYMVEYADLDEVWLLVSPHNPLRERVSPDEDIHRCRMVQHAIENKPRIRFCDIEFSLPQPSYTCNTLDTLSRKYPQHSFSLIIGADNWHIFDRWRNYQEIIDRYNVCIYPRQGYDITPDTLPGNVRYVPAPIIELSSTWIREGIAEGKDMSSFLPDGVFRYIKQNGLYQTL